MKTCLMRSLEMLKSKYACVSLIALRLLTPDCFSSQGATSKFIDDLPNVHEAESETATCPVCLATHATILTEQEYAEVSDFAGDDLGLRRLPCRHVLCGKCARRWLKLVSHRQLRFRLGDAVMTDCYAICRIIPAHSAAPSWTHPSHRTTPSSMILSSLHLSQAKTTRIRCWHCLERYLGSSSSKDKVAVKMRGEGHLEKSSLGCIHRRWGGRGRQRLRISCIHDEVNRTFPPSITKWQLPSTAHTSFSRGSLLLLHFLSLSQALGDRWVFGQRLVPSSKLRELAQVGVCVIVDEPAESQSVPRDKRQVGNGHLVAD